MANCVQPHPSLPVLATSGIENVVRLWRPGDAKEPPNQRGMMALVSHNQERLKNGTNIFRTVNPRVLAVSPPPPSSSSLTANNQFIQCLADDDFKRSIGFQQCQVCKGPRSHMTAVEVQRGQLATMLTGLLMAVGPDAQPRIVEHSAGSCESAC